MDSWMTEQRILFMSESNMLLRLFEENLDNEMYEIEVMDCEIKGVESVEQLHPDLILLDVEEEQQKRWDFLDVVKHHDATANIPVLLCTDVSQELQEQERNFQMLNIQLLYKPFNKEDLLAALRQIVQPFSSAAEVADAHKRNISMLRSVANRLSALAQKILPGWTPSFFASAKQRLDEAALQDSRLQKRTDLLEAEEGQEQERDDELEPIGKQEVLLEVSSEKGQELENLLEQIDRPEETQEKETEDQQEQGAQTEVKLEKNVEEQQEPEKENLPVLEEQPRELLSAAR